LRAQGLAAKIVLERGEQTGADRAALDFTVPSGTPHGGW